MNNDQTARSARRVATLVAIPLAALTGFFAFQALKPTPSAAPAAPPSPTPVNTARVDVPVATLDERQTLVCRALLSKMPDTLRGQARRPVSGGHEQNAAFGDPATTVVCGAPLPTVGMTDKVSLFSGVCWYPTANGKVWTAVDREVPIAVTMPTESADNGQWAVALSSIITASVPSAEKAPGGCTNYQ